MENDLSEGSVNTLSLAFAEGLYADYLKDPNLVPPDWQQYFADLTPDADFSRAPKLGPSFRAASLFNAPVAPAMATRTGPERQRRATAMATRRPAAGATASPTSRFAKIASTR